jgi:hypothetical protein
VLSGAVGEVLLVDADLPVDDLKALVEFGELVLDVSLVLS